MFYYVLAGLIGAMVGGCISFIVFGIMSNTKGKDGK